MNWPLVAYMVAGVFLTLLICALEDDGLDSLDIRLALFVGPFVGVPVFVIVMLLFFNWGKLFRMAWSAWSRRASPDAATPQEEQGR